MTDRVALTPEQLDALAAQVARHLAAALAGEPLGGLIDAAEVARRHGVTRAWVYEHADRLGAVRLGSGSRPRLRLNASAFVSSSVCAVYSLV